MTTEAPQQPIVDILNATPEELIIYRQLAMQRFDWFCVFVCGYWVTPFHAKMIAHRFSSKSNMLLAPRGSGKSLILDVAYLLWRILRDPNLRICIASKTGPQSKSFLGQIKQHMDNNEKFLKLFGELRGETWNEDEITIKTRTKILKEPTICAKAVGSGVPGFHFDMILADDLCDLENTATENQRNKMHQWFYIVLAPTLEPHGEFYVLGTRYNSDDIYGWLAAPKKDANGHLVPDKWNDKRFGPNTAVIPALIVEEDGTETSFWPEYFPLSYLQDKREEGLLSFNLAYQNDASISEGGIIKLEDLEKHTWTSYSQIPPLEDMMIFQGCDPAISQKQTADFFAHCTIAVHQNRDIYILEITKHRFTFNEQVDYLLQQQAKWGAALVGIETIAYQKALVQAIKDRSSWFPVHEVRPRVDKTMRAKILSAFTQRHEIHFNSAHYEAMETLAGMPNPGSKHDDLFDAVDIAVEAAKQMALSQNVIMRLPSNFRGR